MIKKIHIWIVLLFSFLPFLSFSTHIVGGSLTYVHVAGTPGTYVVTLKLYRDCGGGTAAFPGSVTINVRGNNGATFNPSRNFTMPLLSVTNVPSSLDPCAVPPNPMPCVQEGIYTATVTNLPSNPGGYHMYYQVCCRNASVQNIVNPLSAGSSFYAYIPEQNTYDNSSPVFNLFPPLFICVNQQFTFNHAATDLDGDSLTYSLYQPFNDAPAPTFPGNTATFNGVTWVAGYNTNNPLGATPFSINPTTGVLTGTPGQLGQFVVGVVVTEWRNGVAINRTLRDFQFNVLNCPAPPPSLAVANATINNGCSYAVTAAGVSSVSVTWNSIAPGTPGQYNNMLACTAGCLNNTVTATAGAPAFVDYVVCGISTSCAGGSICDTFRVHFNPTLGVTIAPLNPTLCFGQSVTTLTATGSGGSPPYVYLWDNTVTTQTFAAGVGVHTIKLSDGSGCPPVFNSVTVTSFTVPITANAGADKTVCVQSPTTTVSGSITGATGGIWSGGNGTYSPSNTTLSNLVYIPTAAELAAGSVSLFLTTTGNGGCPGDKDTVKITYQNFTGVLTATRTPITCFGLTNGSGTVTVTGGTAPFTYIWNSVPSQTTPIVSGLGVGTYSVMVTNGIGCVKGTTISITQPNPLNVNVNSANAKCNAVSNGSISVSVSGGTTPYSYSWGTTPGTGPSIINLPAGTYTSTVTDAKGCSITRTVAITQPTPLSLTFTTTNLTCLNSANGSIQATVNGGTSPYTYTWNPTGGNGSTANGLNAGTYSLQVRDANNCSINSSTVVTQPALLQVAVTATNETCANLDNGQAFATPSGGTPVYSYTWQPIALNTQSVTNLTAGSYTLTVKDVKGCQTNTIINITQPAPLTLTVMNSSNINCFGGNNGSITTSAIGGTPAYIYSWQPIVNSSNSATGLSAGVYTINVSDVKTCTASIVVTVSQPSAPLTASASSSSVSCNGGTNGSISSLASGGTVPYNYFWSPININGQNVTNVGSGNYSVLITDAKGCTASATTIVNQPSAIGVTVNSANSNCSMANGQATVSVSGGLTPYSYQWSPIGGSNPIATGLPAGSYTVTVTDGNGCIVNSAVSINDNAGPSVSILSTTNVACFGGNTGGATVGISSGSGPFTFSWQPSGGTGQTATGLTAGTYVVTVTDSNGCQSLATTSPAITEPSQIQITTTKSDVSCFGGNNGSASASATGGTGAFTYSWSPSGTTGTNINSLSAGIHTVTVTDGNSCVQTQTVSIVQPALLSVIISTLTDVSCFGGSNGAAYTTVTGGTSPYSYNWSSGSITTNAVGLAAGSISITITDAKGCTANTNSIIAQPPAALTLALTSTAVSCFNGADGSASVVASGGTPGYTYNWTPGPGSSPLLSGVGAGVKLVVVSDANGCNTTGFVTVNQPTAITATVISTNPSCGNSNGQMSVLVSGGSTPYTYTWVPTNTNGPSLVNLAPGGYSVNITDGKGCAVQYSGSLVNIPGPSLSLLSSSNTSCYNGTNGLAFVNASGGTAPYSYNWFPYGGNSSAAANLSAGDFTCTVFDANNCPATLTLTITEPSPIDVTVSNQLQPACFGGSNGNITVSVAGGTPSYSYLWAPFGGGNATAINLTAGIYTVTVSDSHGCSTSITSQLAEPPLLQGIFISKTDPTCFNVNNGTISTGVVGGSPPYQFNWQTTPAQVGTQAVNLGAGTFTLLITDNHNCVATVTTTLIQPGQVITSAGVGDTICKGQSTTISASASGGSGNYFYYWTPSSGGNTSTQNVSPLTTTNFTVTGYDQNGCAGTSNIIHVEVYSLSSANVDVFGQSPICPGQVSAIYAQTTGNTGPLTYTWNHGLGSGPGTFLTFPTIPTTYVATVTSVCGISVIDSVQIFFNPPPTIGLTTNATTACAPGYLNFFDNSTSGNPLDLINTWTWNFGDGTTSNQQNPIHFYSTAGTYTVKLTVTTDAGCTNNNGSAPLSVTVNPIPTANFTVNATQLNIPFDILHATNQSSGAVSYVWNFGDGSTATTLNANHLYSSLGTFEVQLIAINQFGCKDTAFVQVETTTEIKIPTAFTPNEGGPSGGIYDPTSTNNDVFFPYTSGVKKYHFSIFNRWGELIFETFDFKQGWDGYYRGKICPEAMYVWKIELDWENGKQFIKAGDVTLLR